MKNMMVLLMVAMVASPAFSQEAIAIPGKAPAAQASDKLKPSGIEALKKMHADAERKLLTKEPTDDIQASMVMSKCVEASIGQKALLKMKQNGKMLDQQLRQLCKEKKIEEAKTLKLTYATNFAASPEYKAMKTCSEKYTAFIDSNAFTEFRRDMDRANTEKTDVCG